MASTSIFIWGILCIVFHFVCLMTITPTETNITKVTGFTLLIVWSPIFYESLDNEVKKWKTKP